MNQRERILAVAVAILLAALGGYWAFSQVRGSLSRRAGLRDQVVAEIAKKQLVLDRAQRVTHELAAYEQMSLPANVELARSQYQAWLSELLDGARLKDPQVRVISQNRRASGASQLTCHISGDGDLNQLAQLLYDFYRVDTIHRIRRMPIKPIPETKQLDITLIVEALILPTADPMNNFDATRLSPFAESLADQFTQKILNRNMFSAANSPPRVESVSRQRIEQGKPWSLTVRASDRDALDSVHFALADNAPPGMEIDRESGRLRWTPRELGDYQLTVVATDDGIPFLNSEQEISIQVVEASMAPSVAETQKPGFDVARFTFAIATLEISGRRQLWLQLRTSGEIMKLFEGDEVHIGSVDGTVAKIGERDAQLEVDGELVLIRIGQPLVGTTVAADGQ